MPRKNMSKEAKEREKLRRKVKSSKRNKKTKDEPVTSPQPLDLRVSSRRTPDPERAHREAQLVLPETVELPNIQIPQLPNQFNVPDIIFNQFSGLFEFQCQSAISYLAFHWYFYQCCLFDAHNSIGSDSNQ